MSGTTEKTKSSKPRLFESVESYKHKLAKDVLIEWIRNAPRLIDLKEIYKIKTEESQCDEGNVVFVPDITVYSDKGICAFIEINHTHSISDIKLDNICTYLDRHDWLDVVVYEISADWILNQTKQPDVLNCQKLVLVNHDTLDNLF